MSPTMLTLFNVCQGLEDALAQVTPQAHFRSNEKTTATQNEILGWNSWKVFPQLNTVLTSHTHLLSPVFGSDLELVVGLGHQLSKSFVVFLFLPSSTFCQGWLQIPAVPTCYWLGSLVLWAPTHQKQRVVSAPPSPLKLAKITCQL